MPTIVLGALPQPKVKLQSVSVWLHECNPDTHATGTGTRVALLKGLEFLQSGIFFEGLSSLKLDLQSGL